MFGNAARNNGTHSLLSRQRARIRWALRGEIVMRIACSALLIAGAALFAGSPGAIAAPASGGAIKAAADEIGLGESVHCRPFRHWHRWGFGRGCGGPGVTFYERGPRFRHRFGVREEFRGGFRTRDRAGVTIPGED